MSAAHGLGDAGGVLDGPARPAHFEIGRPPQPARSCRCRRMGTKEAGMGNYVNADICHRRDADRALARTSSNRLQHGLGGSHWTLVGRPAAAGQQAPPDRRPTPDPVRRLPERGNRHDVTQFMPLLKRPAPPSAPQAVHAAAPGCPIRAPRTPGSRVDAVLVVDGPGVLEPRSWPLDHLSLWPPLRLQDEEGGLLCRPIGQRTGFRATPDEGFSPRAWARPRRVVTPSLV